jgi:hypothetical protein
VSLCPATYINIGHGRLMDSIIKSNTIYFSYTFCHRFLVFPFSLIRSLSRRPNSLSCRGLNLSIKQTSLGQRRSFSSKPSSAPDYRQSQQNRTIWFSKPDSPISTALSRSFSLVFNLCGNTFWRLHWGIDYFTYVKHEG